MCVEISKSLNTQLGILFNMVAICIPIRRDIQYGIHITETNLRSLHLHKILITESAVWNYGPIVTRNKVNTVKCITSATYSKPTDHFIALVCQ